MCFFFRQKRVRVLALFRNIFSDDRTSQRPFQGWYRPIPQEFRLPMVSPSWTRSSSALFALTDGVFDPRKDGVKKRRLTSPGEVGRDFFSKSRWYENGIGLTFNKRGW